jgi:tetratricopeptide (TPR) repeat protein
MSGYTVTHVDDIPELNDGRSPMKPVRHHLGISAFGVSAWTAKNAGDRVINEHQEQEGDDPADEELYVVTRGHAVFEVDGERVDAPAGTMVFVQPRSNRTAFAEEAGTTIVAVGATVGEAYKVVGWEPWAPLRAAYEAGRYDEVIDRLRELVVEHPQYGLLFYNLACCESLTGQKPEALDHLRRALELSDMFREYARGDSDLDAIRDEPGFADLVGAQEVSGSTR